MARRIRIRLRRHFFILFIFITALPVVASRDLFRVRDEVDLLIDEGILAFDELEDVLQVLIDLRASVLSLAAEPTLELLDEHSRVIRRLLAQLRRDAAQLAAIDVERLLSAPADKDLVRLLRQTDKDAQRLVSQAQGRALEGALLFAEARAVSNQIDEAASAVHAMSLALGARARISDSSIPRLLLRAFALTVLLAAVTIVLLLAAFVETLQGPRTKKALGLHLEDWIRSGSARATGADPLARAGSAPGPTGRILQVISDTPTHQTFTARIVTAEGGVRVWGKHYTWLGVLRSLVPPWPRMYARGTWRLLEALAASAVRSPRPLGFHTRRVAGLPAGYLVIAEYLRGLRPVRGGLLGAPHFEKASQEARRLILRRLLEFVEQLHRASCFQLKIRYFHVRPAGPGGNVVEDPEFVLCDLDKVIHLPGAPAFVRALLCRHDRRRIAAKLAPLLRDPEAALVKEWSAGRGAGTG